MNLKEQLQEINKRQVHVSMFFTSTKDKLLRAAENQQTSLMFYLYDRLLITNLEAEGLTVRETLGAVGSEDYIRVIW
jgi:hypothetical protein